MDAKDFFADYWPGFEYNLNVVPWENLRKLALTSRLLHPRVELGQVDMLLMAAGRAAAFMPKLEVMEIWNGGEGHACVFRYSKNAGKPEIRWASNWGSLVPMDPNVVCCWSNLPRRGRHPYDRNLSTAVKRIPARRKQVKTYATTIRYLKLRSRVLDLISGYQLFWDEQN